MCLKKYSVIFLLLLSSNCFALEKIKLILDWYPNVNHDPIYQAKKSGLFEMLGYDVEIIIPSDPSDPLKYVASGKADIAVAYPSTLIHAKKYNLPLIKIATLVGRPLNCMIVDAKGQIKKIEDLKGKQIAYSDPSTDLIMLERMLRHHNMELNDVNLINVHYSLSQALITHHVDAIIGAMRNVEPEELKSKGFVPKLFYPEDHGVENYEELIFIARSDR